MIVKSSSMTSYNQCHHTIINHIKFDNMSCFSNNVFNRYYSVYRQFRWTLDYSTFVIIIVLESTFFPKDFSLPPCQLEKPFKFREPKTTAKTRF